VVETSTSNNNNNDLYKDTKREEEIIWFHLVSGQIKRVQNYNQQAVVIANNYMHSGCNTSKP